MDVVVIIIMVLSIVFSISQSNKKKKAGSKPQPNSLEEILGELLGGDQTIRENFPTVNEETGDEEEEWDPESFPEDRVSPTLVSPMESRPSFAGAPVVMKSSRNDEIEENVTRQVEGRNQKSAPVVAGKDEKKARTIKDPRDLIVYSAIMEPKYREY